MWLPRRHRAPSPELAEVRAKREVAERENAKVKKTIVTLREVREYNHVAPRIARLMIRGEGQEGT